MATFFTSNKDEQFFTPFGPGMAKFKLSDTFVNKMNDIIEGPGRGSTSGLRVGNIRGPERNAPLKDFSDNLVGKVDEELLFDDNMKEMFLKETRELISKYAGWMEIRNSMGARSMNSDRNRYGIQFIAGWVVRQREGEYNPLHIHTGCKLSCVGYLSMPEGIDKEFEEDYKDHHPSHGHIQFCHGTPSHWNMTNFMIRPRVGDFYLFPADLFHCVYPFYTPGERRSFSVNLNFLEMPRNETGT